ncbi:HPr kinase [Candidatus Terasakiella magnetica]|nr:HPr kinase [Candidatus Terasakiella magnetica]
MELNVASSVAGLCLCGLRVVSDFPLPELPPWVGDDRPADMVIRRGKVPSALPDLVRQTPFAQFAADGTARFEIADVGAFLIRGGCEVVLAPRLPDDAPDIGLFLLGSVFGFLCHQRGLLPLHASCVEVDGRAIAFAGPSGVGKSTLAAALLAQGWRLLSDDVTVVDLGRALVLPSFPRQKLWQDSLEALALSPGRRLRSGMTMEKFEVWQEAGFRDHPLKLAAVCHVVEERLSGRPPLTRHGGLAALALVRSAIYRRAAGEALAGGDGIFTAAAALAANVPQFGLCRPMGFDRLAGFAEALPGLLRERLP